MKAVIQRVTYAKVRVNEQIVGQIGKGLLVLVGFTHSDAEPDLTYMAEKIQHLRIFEDSEGKMNESLLDVGGEILVVSQFTLYGDATKGRRPNFMEAARPSAALPLYDYFVSLLRQQGLLVQSGVFGAMMQVESCNDGPVTILLDTDHL